MTLYVMLVAFVVAPFYGQALRWRDQVKAKRIAEEHRITPHEYLAGVEERLVLSEPWPTRQTPMLWDQIPPETPAPAPLVVSEPNGLALDGHIENPVREQDHFSIAAQVWAHQQLDRIYRTLADPIGTAWNTPTGEWDVSLLGLSVPDSPASLSLFLDVT